MNKSHQYNQQTEPKQCKSEVEEMCIYQNLESGCHNICFLKKYLLGFMLEGIPLKQQYLKVSHSMILHSVKNVFIFTSMQSR